MQSVARPFSFLLPLRFTFTFLQLWSLKVSKLRIDCFERIIWKVQIDCYVRPNLFTVPRSLFVSAGFLGFESKLIILSAEPTQCTHEAVPSFRMYEQSLSQWHTLGDDSLAATNVFIWWIDEHSRRRHLVDHCSVDQEQL